MQATDKEGNPTIMSLSPSGVLAISEISQQRQGIASNTTSGGTNDVAKTHSQTGRTARAEPGRSSGPAEGTNVVPTQGSDSAGEPGRPGLPGDKNGPAVTPSTQHQH